MRLLVLAALALASASALTPFSASPAKEGCALLLDSAVGGKSSAFDRARNVFYGADQYDGAGTCITYSAVNEALQQALNYLRQYLAIRFSFVSTSSSSFFLHTRSPLPVRCWPNPTQPNLT